MSFLLPVERLRETDTLVAFNHPQPSHKLHILIVPKRARPNILALTEKDVDFLTDLVEVVQSLVTQFDLESTAYRLINNGGDYQEVDQLHFHLVADEYEDNLRLKD